MIVHFQCSHSYKLFLDAQLYVLSRKILSEPVVLQVFESLCRKFSIYFVSREGGVSYLGQRTLFGQSALVHFFEQLFQCVPDGCVIPLLTRQIL